MQIDDVPVSVGPPELVASGAQDVNGLDLLGLRAPAEAIANSLLNGVTTVTPNIRYIAFRAWLISRYLQLGGLNSWTAFRVFAAKAEAAIAYATRLVDDRTPGIVGSDRAAPAVNQNGTTLTLKTLTKILAIDIYAQSGEALGIGENSGSVPTITPERGVPLAQSFGMLVGAENVLSAISLTDEEQVIERPQLVELGKIITMGRPSTSERQRLIEALVPATPRKNGRESELNRIACYCLLLHLAKVLGREVIESDIFFATSRFSLDSIPEQLHKISDGWVRFAVRDLLVLTHEAALSLVLRELSQGGGSEKRRPAEEVVSSIASRDFDSSLAGLGLKVKADQPISDLCKEVIAVLGQTVELRGLRRWTGALSEILLLEKGAWLRNPEGIGLLPVSWIIAGHRLEKGILDSKPEFDFDTQAGFYRIGIGAVVLPEVEDWKNSSKSIRDVTAWLVERSVDQHLRIAWSRLAREPYKDVGLLRSDGEAWVYQKTFNAGRATSRLYQAINWLHQLGLADRKGITSAGADLLEAGLTTLSQNGGRPE
jgi:hypothetical protein